MDKPRLHAVCSTSYLPPPPWCAPVTRKLDYDEGSSASAYTNKYMIGALKKGYALILLPLHYLQNSSILKHLLIFYHSIFQFSYETVSSDLSNYKKENSIALYNLLADYPLKPVILECLHTRRWILLHSIFIRFSLGFAVWPVSGHNGPTWPGELYIYIYI